MLTTDANIVDIDQVVWNINDPAELLFNLRDPQVTVQAVSEAVMREIITGRAVSPPPAIAPSIHLSPEASNALASSATALAK